MKIQLTSRFVRALPGAFLISTAACSAGGTEGAAGGDFAFTGQLASRQVGALQPTAASPGKTITHVMAISPQVASPQRLLAEVDASGHFTLSVPSGRPYVLVFLADGQGFTGPGMIAGLVRVDAAQLDTLAPTGPGSADLGSVSVDGASLTATVSTDLSTLLGSLGLTEAEAGALGAVDDLSLRAANPDVDGDGVIDVTQGRSFWLDWHVRATTRVDGRPARFSDAVGRFLEAPTLSFELSSGYAVYPRSFYDGVCADSSGGPPGPNLPAGCSFAILDLGGAAATSAWPFGSFSGGAFSDYRQWGPDFRAPAQELPGSAGQGVTLAYGFPNGETLTFWNVRTRPNASLTQDGTLLPFLRFDTADGTPTGALTGVAWEWRRLAGGAWVPATATEVAVLVGPEGAMVRLSTRRVPGSEEGFSLRIPRDAPSGVIPWSSEQVHAEGSTAVMASATPAGLCGSAVSYDDTLGLRIFAGSFEADEGTTPCP